MGSHFPCARRMRSAKARTAPRPPGTGARQVNNGVELGAAIGRRSGQTCKFQAGNIWKIISHIGDIFQAEASLRSASFECGKLAQFALLNTGHAELIRAVRDD